LILILVTESEGLPRFPKMPIRRQITDGVSSQEALRTTLDWIVKCEGLHKSCQRGPKDTRPPTRLVSIGVIGAEHIKVVETSIPVKWVCLSHRWGSKRPSCLTTGKNYEEQLQGISLEAVPQTFQDAIAFTRRLGFQFIWIDSLCIIQDSDEDWRKESSRMADYYGGAVLTISATGSVDSDSGLFNQTSVPSVQLQFSGTFNITISARRKLTHALQGSGKTNTEEVPPILTRAWVYQERLLSRRVLHFTAQEIQWECRENTKCYCDFLQPTPSDPKISHQRALNSMETSYNSNPLLERWIRIVEEYSPLQLSYSRDRLPALSGLAKQIQEHAKTGLGQYVAGLWDGYTGEFIGWKNALLWAKREDEPLTKRPVPWGGPTWTWASVNGGVSYLWEGQAKGHGSLCFVSNEVAHTSPVTRGEPTGEIQAASLSLRGPVEEGTLIYPSPPKPKTFAHEFQLHTNVVGRSVEKLYVDYALHEERDLKNHIADREKVKVLRICHLGNEPRVVSLVLKELVEGSGMCYRIGIAEELSPREHNTERWSDELNWPRHQGKLENLTIL
jgi:Heterokaryon incompatibility protein (HET)